MDPRRQRFRCYGCGRAGDVIDFLRYAHNVGFKEALHIAADLAGVSLPSGHFSTPRTHKRPSDARWRGLARKAALEVEKGLPRPRTVGEIPEYDWLYARKDRLDRGVAFVCDQGTLALFLQGLINWRNGFLRSMEARKGVGG